MKLTKRNIAIATVSATTILLAACSNEPDDTTVGQQIDRTVAETKQEMSEAKVDAKQAANETQAKAEKAADRTGDAIAETATDVKQGAKELWSDTKEAANNAGEAVSSSLADAGQAVEDTTITTKVKAKIIDAELLDGTDIDVTTTQGVVKLEGVVASAEMRDMAGKLAMAVEGVKSVENDIELKS